jgi:hypothetical protein
MQSSNSAPRLVNTPLVLMSPRPDGFDAVWGVNQLSQGRVEWEHENGATGQAAMDSFGFVPQGDQVLKVRVSGLQPGQRYRVRCITSTARNDAKEISGWKEFVPLNPAAPATTFVVWNDTHINNQTIRQLHRATPPADFLVWNGDTCNDWTAEDLLRPTLLHPGGCDITEGKPLFLTWGNHDVRGQYAFKAPQFMAMPEGHPFHAFRSGPLAAICLHTGEDKPDSHPSFGGRVALDVLRKEQALWLAEVIRRPDIANAPYRIVFCHIPLRWLQEKVPDYDNKGFDAFSKRSRDAWHRSLVEWKAQLIISGHTHHHAWLPPTEEWPYGQLVGGGPQLNSATWMHGKADSRALQIRVMDLDGAVRHEVEFAPIAS